MAFLVLKSCDKKNINTEPMATSMINKRTFGFEWIKCETIIVIENAKLMLNSFNLSSKSFQTSDFNLHAEDKNVWRLVVTFAPKSIQIHLCNDYKYCDVDADASLSILDSDGYKKNTKHLLNHRFLPSQNARYCTNFVTSEEMPKFLEDMKLLPNGDLTIHCKITALGTYSGSHKERNNISEKIKIPGNNIGNDLETLIHDEKHADVIIAVDKKEIKAHKVILSLRSPVFAAMFGSGSQHRVIISDLEYEVVLEMVHFIYTGKAPKLSVMADRLLAAADKYSLDALKAMCEQELYKTVSVDTVTELMAMVDLHNANQLKEKLGEFIAANIKELMTNASWTKMMFNKSLKLYSNAEK